MQADSYSKMGKLNNTNFPWCHQLSYIKPHKWLCLTSYVTQVISVFVLVGVIFVPIGIVSLRASQQVCPISCLLGLKYKLSFCLCWLFSLLQVVEIVDRYDDACVPAGLTDKLAYIRNDSIPKACTRNLTVMELSACLLLT